jgi:hypothetical protein
MATSAFAAGKFSYNVGIQIQNLSGSEASTTLDYYNQDGTSAGSFPLSIAANDAETVFPIHAASGFNGSVVVSSNQPVAAISNVLGDGGDAAAAYEGANSGGTTVLLPLLMQDNAGFDTWYNVQNVGSTDATVNVSYSDGSSAGPVVIKPGAAQTFDQSAETHTLAVFSAVITSDQPIVAAVIEENNKTMFAYSGFNAGSTAPVMPLINANNSGFITGVQIQNAGASDTDVTVSYTAVTGTDCSETQNVGAGESKTFTLAAFASGANGDCIAGATFVGSATVTGNTNSQPLVTIVNQLGGKKGEAYSGFDPASASDTVVLPLIMDRNAGYFTGFNIVNAGASQTDISCTFTGTAYTASLSNADPGDALNDLQLDSIADSYVGAATCTATGGDALILGVVNELGPGAKDVFLVYNGINN